MYHTLLSREFEETYSAMSSAYWRILTSGPFTESYITYFNKNKNKIKKKKKKMHRRGKI